MTLIQRYLLYVIAAICFPWVFLLAISAISQFHPRLEFDASPICETENRILSAYISPLCQFGQASQTDCHTITRSFQTALDIPVYEAAVAEGVDDAVAHSIYKKLRPDPEKFALMGVRICGPGRDASANLKLLFLNRAE